MEDTKTRLELVYQVLDNLGILVPGQAPPDEMVAKVDTRLDPVLASLRTREICYVSDPGTPSPPTNGAIAAEVFLALADVIADRVAGAFNLAGDTALKSLAILAEDELRVIQRPQRTRKMLRVDAQLRSPRRNIPGNFSRGT
jgi:hypothetical protein